jgi:hypothetical protein
VRIKGVLKNVLEERTGDTKRSSSGENLMRYCVARCRDLLQRKGLMQLIVIKESLTRKGINMPIDSHDRSSGRCHSQRKEHVRVYGNKRMSDEYFDKEMVELK